jgi:hypothetical protein
LTKQKIVHGEARPTAQPRSSDQSDAWIGKPLEIYVYSNVWVSSERTSATRVRIPTGPAPIGKRPSPGDRNGTVLQAIGLARSSE